MMSASIRSSSAVVFLYVFRKFQAAGTRAMAIASSVRVMTPPAMLVTLPNHVWAIGAVCTKIVSWTAVACRRSIIDTRWVQAWGQPRPQSPLYEIRVQAAAGGLNPAYGYSSAANLQELMSAL